MKNLELEMFGVQEVSKIEMKSLNGGSWLKRTWENVIKPNAGTIILMVLNKGKTTIDL